MLVRSKGNAKPAERSLKGKGDSARQRDYCPFTMVVGMERLGVTGGASPLPYEKREG